MDEKESKEENKATKQAKTKSPEATNQQDPLPLPAISTVAGLWDDMEETQDPLPPPATSTVRSLRDDTDETQDPSPHTATSTEGGLQDKLKPDIEETRDPKPVKEGVASNKIYSWWYDRLNRFYSRLPTVYTEDNSTPNVEFNHLATVERRRYGAKSGKDITDFLDATIHGIDGYYEKAEKVEYKDILNCDKVTSGKRVVISGAPGCGRTTLSRKLCQDLYSQALPNQYRLVLLVELRKLRVLLSDAEGDIDKVFENAQEGDGLQLLLGMSGASDTAQLCEKIRENDGEGVALILDGFDEVVDHLGKSPFLSDLLSVEEPFLSECDVFVTTRPSRCPDLLSLMKRPHRHVEILGFTDTDIDQYIQHYFLEAYRTDKKEAECRSKEVIQRLNSLSVVRGMCRIPMVLRIVCKVQDHLGSTPLPETVNGIFSAYICHQLIEYLAWGSQITGAPIEDVLNVPIDLFPGFYALCQVAYNCCSDKNGQRLILTEDDLKDVKDHLDKRGSIYNLLFSERVDKTAPSAGHLYQFNHKAVQETLAAIHIAKQSLGDQQRIWKSEFGRPEMAEVWKIYCGITRLKWVDLIDLSLSSLSQRARDAGVPADVDDEVVMTSLFEADHPSVSARVLPSLLKNSISFRVRSPYNLHIVQSAVQHHPTLETLSLWGDMMHPLGVDNLARTVFVHKNLRKLILSHFHPSDWEIFETSFKTPHNLKAIKLSDAPVNTALTVLSGRVEEVELELYGMEVWYSDEDWRRIDHAVEANRSLRSFGIHCGSSNTLPPVSFIDHLCLNATLKNIDCYIVGSKDSGYSDIPDNSLKSLLVPREKCSVWMRFTPRQWCAVLSGLKDAKTLKELNFGTSPYVASSLYREDITELAIIEENVATSETLVKVDVECGKEAPDLMLSIVKGVSRNRNISELGITYRDESGEHWLYLLKILLHTNHIARLRMGCNALLPSLLGDNWCELIIDGPMSRPVCQLELYLTPAEWGVLLSRVHHAERLQELSLEICTPRQSHEIGDIDDDVIRRVEDVWSNCALKKVNLHFSYHCDVQKSLYNLLGAVMRGIAANNNDVSFVLKGAIYKYHLILELGREHVKQFEIVERGCDTYFISRPHALIGIKRNSKQSPHHQYGSPRPKRKQSSEDSEDPEHVGGDLSVQLGEEYKAVVEQNACITLQITKCTTIGPPRVGKTCLKCLLIGQKWDREKGTASTDAMEAPEWVEVFRKDEHSTWTRLDRDTRKHNLMSDIACRNFDTLTHDDHHSAITSELDPNKPVMNVVNTGENKEDETVSNSVPGGQPKQVERENVPTPMEDASVGQDNSKPKEHKETSNDKLQPSQSEKKASVSIHSEQLQNSETPKLDHEEPSQAIEDLMNRYNEENFQEQLENAKNKPISEPMHTVKYLHFVDTGGQRVYHDVHPVLITSPSVYLVVINLLDCAKEYNILYHDRSKGESPKEKKLPRHSEDPNPMYLADHALRSIHTFTSKKIEMSDNPYFQVRPNRPKIFIIGTHLDQIFPHNFEERRKCLQKFNDIIKERLKGKPYSRLIQYDDKFRCFWAVDNTLAGDEKLPDKDPEMYKYLCLLRNLIQEKSMTFCVRVPIKWQLFEHLTSKQSHFRYKELCDFAHRMKFADPETDEFKWMLRIFHILGLYFFKDRNPLASHQSHVRNDDTIIFTEPGALYKATTELLWAAHERAPDSLVDVKSILTDLILQREIIDIDIDWFSHLLCHLRLMAEVDVQGYVIPAVLPVRQAQQSELNFSVGPLLVTFTQPQSQVSFIPSGLFCALISDLLTSGYKGKSLFRDCVVLTSDEPPPILDLYLTERNSFIEIGCSVYAKDQSVTSLQELSTKCMKTRMFLHDRISFVWSQIYEDHKIFKDIKSSDCEKALTWGFPCRLHPHNAHMAKFWDSPDSQSYCARCLDSRSSLIQDVPDSDLVWFSRIEGTLKVKDNLLVVPESQDS